MMMGMAIKVKMLLAAKEMTMTDVAERLGTSVQNVSGKLRRDNFSEKDLHAIAQACGVTFEGSFIFEDGRRI